jgi:hypothetical protein
VLVDCLTDECVIEFDFSNKWAEAIGQSLYYANQTGKKADIFLICKNKTLSQVTFNNRFLQITHQGI